MVCQSCAVMHHSWQTRAQHGIPSFLGLHETHVLEKQVPACPPPPCSPTAAGSAVPGAISHAMTQMSHVVGW